MSDGLIQAWISGLKAGDGQAAQAIWEKYSDRLARLVLRQLKNQPRRAWDEEDIALSAMNSFFRGAAEGRFPRLADGDDLWKLLVTIAARKLTKHRRHDFAKKRGQGEVRGESVFRATKKGIAGMDAVLGTEPSPELAAEMADTLEGMLGGLDDDALRQIALYTLEGYTNEEIGRLMGCATRTVVRKLKRIRQQWSKGPDA